MVQIIFVLRIYRYGYIMKVAVFTREIDGVLGGMEKQLLKISQALSSLNHEVMVYSIDENPPKVFYENISSGIEFRNLATGDPKKKAGFLQRYKRQKLVYDELKIFQPDVAICFMFGSFLYSRVPTFLLRIPIVLAERNSPEIYRITRVRRMRYLIFLSMLFTNIITIQFARYELKYPRFLKNRLRVIPNAIEEATPVGVMRKDTANFIFAGRFSFQKQPLRLIEAFAIHLGNFPDSKLRMFGNGEQQNAIEELIIKLGLQECVQVSPPVSEIKEVFAQGNILCIPSIWEGFPNVLGEALSYGMPAIGFKNCDGVSDLIIDEWNGWLEEDDASTLPLVRLLDRAAKALSGGV
jgi:GalNAc-alpha-(1->4)-GalNAc-alpha-(1->3)-diNAcBac-PP-undecaprenol alpha-1,4-N-acetyl-D-galactosaminyltransferase